MRRECAGVGSGSGSRSGSKKEKALMLASVASMIDQFNLPNISLMQQMGYEVHVACNFKEGNTCDAHRLWELRKILRKMRVTCHQWDCPRSVGSARKCMRAYRQLLGLMDRHRFAWMHCQSPVGGALARLAAYRRNVRVVYTAHGFHFYRGAPMQSWLLYYPVEKALAHLTDVLVTVNQEDHDFARRHLRAGKVFRIPGVGVDTAYFAGWRKKELDEDVPRQEGWHGNALRQEGWHGNALCQEGWHGNAPRQERLHEARLHKNGLYKMEKGAFCEKYKIPSGAKIILSVGELNQGKNHRMVIDALAAMHRADVCYLICGQGALQEELQRYAQRLGVGAQLRMLGYQGDMAWIYRNADIFVFPSIREGMPVALMEAMAAGLTCVVSDIRGNRELIGDAGGGHKAGTKPGDRFGPGGFCFSLCNTWQLTWALLRLVDDAALRHRCGQYNQEKIKAYDQKLVSKRMRQIYAVATAPLDAGKEYANAGKSRLNEGNVHLDAKKYLDAGKSRLDAKEYLDAGKSRLDAKKYLDAGKKEKQYQTVDAPLVSAIMPVYNLANDPALRRAVGSVLRQTYKNWELILCDDGSTDGTLGILRQFAAMDDRIHVIRTSRNHGAGHARNACIRVAGGKYLAVMDADDISHPQRLERQAGFLDRHPEYALVGCNAWLMDRHGVWGRRRLEERPGRESFLSTLPFVHPSIMIRAETVRELHGYAQTRLARRAEDYEFLMRLYAKGHRGYNLQEELLSYLEAPDSYQKRKYRNRIAECAVRWQGFWRLGILRGHIRYVLKPLIVGLVPGGILRMVRRKRFAVEREYSSVQWDGANPLGYGLRSKCPKGQTLRRPT